MTVVALVRVHAVTHLVTDPDTRPTRTLWIVRPRQTTTLVLVGTLKRRAPEPVFLNVVLAGQDGRHGAPVRTVSVPFVADSVRTIGTSITQRYPVREVRVGGVVGTGVDWNPDVQVGPDGQDGRAASQGQTERHDLVQSSYHEVSQVQTGRQTGASKSMTTDLHVSKHTATGSARPMSTLQAGTKRRRNSRHRSNLSSPGRQRRPRRQGRSSHDATGKSWSVSCPACRTRDAVRQSVTNTTSTNSGA